MYDLFSGQNTPPEVWYQRALQFGQYHLTIQELACLKKVVAANPYDFEARRREIYALHWIGHHGELPAAFARFFRDIEQERENLGRGRFYFYNQDMLSMYFFWLYGQPEYTDQKLLEQYRSYVKIPVQPWSGELPSRRYPAQETDSHQKLRIAYLGREFDKGSCLQLLRPMLAHHSEHVDIFIYDDSPEAHSKTRQQFESRVKSWQSTMLTSNEDLLAQIRADQIDVLVDVAGPTYLMRNEVFWERAAPVQVGGLGFVFSSAKYLDYCLSDRLLAPPEVAQYYPDPVYYIPSIFVWETPEAFDANVPQHEGLVLGSANSLNKLNLEVIATWAEVLKRLPEATLFLKSSRFNDLYTQQMYRELFQHFGISAHRLRLEKGRREEEHLPSFYNQIDIALDTFPYQGAITTCDALWMGTPVVSLRHPDWQGRALGATILDHVGRSEWVAKDTADYIEKVVALAAHPARRQQYKGQLRSELQQSIICQPAAFAQSLEQAYFEMYQSAPR